MHFESEVYSIYKHRNQEPWRPVTLSANSSLWQMRATIIFTMTGAPQPNVYDNKLIMLSGHETGIKMQQFYIRKTLVQ